MYTIYQPFMIEIQERGIKMGQKKGKLPLNDAKIDQQH